MSEHANITTVNVGENVRVRVQVIYNPDTTPRGYELFAWPEHLETSGGVTFAVTKIRLGGPPTAWRQKIEPTTRLNKKRLATLAVELLNDPRTIAAIAHCRAVLESEAA